MTLSNSVQKQVNTKRTKPFCIDSAHPRGRNTFHCRKYWFSHQTIETRTIKMKSLASTLNIRMKLLWIQNSANKMLKYALIRVRSPEAFSTENDFPPFSPVQIKTQVLKNTFRCRFFFPPMHLPWRKHFPQFAEVQIDTGGEHISFPTLHRKHNYLKKPYPKHKSPHNPYPQS